jgi:hypothetical protein
MEKRLTVLGKGLLQWFPHDEREYSIKILTDKPAEIQHSLQIFDLKKQRGTTNHLSAQ